MRIQVVSDLHLEFPDADISIENAGNVDLLVLSGDICTTKSARFRQFFERCSKEFPHVVWIAGNHEFYRDDIGEAHDKLREIVAGLDNVHYLNNETVDIGSHLIFGATLWTDCNGNDFATKQTLAYGMNDYRLISNKRLGHWNLRPEDTMSEHFRTLSTLTAALETSAKPVIVVGHHAPSKTSINSKYIDEFHMNGGYSSDLDQFIRDYKHKIALWTHGHCHDSFDYKIAGVRVVCNPRGYWSGHKNENAAFDPLKVIEIG